MATAVFLGSLLFGIGPLVSLLPGPYRVGADNLSYGSPSLALARWADTHLPAGSHVAADKDNGVLLNALSGVVPVTAQSGLVSPVTLYFDRRLSIYDIYLIRKADIRYIVVDDRMVQELPLYGTYIAVGEPLRRLTSSDLNKFDTYPFIKRIYDNGPIQVYDMTGILSPSERAAPAGPSVGGSGLNVGVLVLAVATAVLWLRRLRRRREPLQDPAHKVVCALVGALVIAVLGAFVVRLSHASPEVVAFVVLGVLLVLSLHPARLRDVASRKLGATGAPVQPGAVMDMRIGPAFYERREIRDMLAYLRVLAYDDESSLRRIFNRPRRGIGATSVSRLAAWAQWQHTSLADALDHATEAGLNGKSLEGAQRLGQTLAELRPALHTTNPGDLIDAVANRTGYRSALESEQTDDARRRVEHLVRLVAEASAFDDVTGFLQMVAVRERSTGVDPSAAKEWPIAKRPAPVRAAAEQSARRLRRAQLLPGGVGVALFALGATLATVAALGEWTPPPELSVATSTTDRSVAQVQLGSAGPLSARVEIRHGDRTVWSSNLDRTTGVQNVELPAHLLNKGSRVVLVADGRTLRRVDGWVRIVPPPRVGHKTPASLGRLAGHDPGTADGVQGERLQNDAEPAEDLEVRHVRRRPDKPEERVGSDRQFDRQELRGAQGPVHRHGGCGTNRGRGLPPLAAKLVSSSVNRTGSGGRCPPGGRAIARRGPGRPRRPRNRPRRR